MSIEHYTRPFADAIESTARDSLATHDVTGPIKDWSPVVDDNDKLVLEYKPNGRQYKLTPHAMTQLCVKSGLMTTLPKLLENKKDGKGSVVYHRTRRDAELVRDVIDYHMWNGDRHDQDKEYLVRTNNDDGTIRAVLSSRYAIVNNVWFLEQIREKLGNTEVLASRWRGGADTVYGELVFPETRREYDDSIYYAGLSVGNSEIGIRRVSLDSFVMREVCSNGMVSNGRAITRKNWKHLGSPKLDEISSWIGDIVAMGADHAIDQMEAMREMMKIQIPENVLGGVFVQMMTKLKIRQEEQRAIWQHIDAERGVIQDGANSLFGIHSALTRYAQTTDNDVWVRMEEDSSKLLTYNDDKVSRLVANAPNIDVDHLAV